MSVLWMLDTELLTLRMFMESWTASTGTSFETRLLPSYWSKSLIQIERKQRQYQRSKKLLLKVSVWVGYADAFPLSACILAIVMVKDIYCSTRLISRRKLERKIAA